MIEELFAVDTTFYLASQREIPEKTNINLKNAFSGINVQKSDGFLRR